MYNKYIPKLNLPQDMLSSRISTLNQPVRLDSIGDTPEIPSFKDVMSGMIKELDSTVKSPDKVMEDSVLGNGADIHDVMIAMSKAEVGINLATQMTSKVMQAYDKVISIQV